MKQQQWAMASGAGSAGLGAQVPPSPLGYFLPAKNRKLRIPDISPGF